MSNGLVKGLNQELAERRARQRAEQQPEQQNGLLGATRRHQSRLSRGLRGAGRLGRQIAGRSAAQFGRMGSELSALYSRLYVPIQERLAKRLEVPESEAVGRAAIDVESAFDVGEGQIRRGLSRMGVSPETGRFAGLLSKWGRQRAATKAGAMTRARQTARTETTQNLFRLAGMGAGVPGQAMQAYAGERTGLATGADISFREAEQEGRLAEESGFLYGLTRPRRSARGREPDAAIGFREAEEEERLAGESGFFPGATRARGLARRRRPSVSPEEDAFWAAKDALPQFAQ